MAAIRSPSFVRDSATAAPLPPRPAFVTSFSGLKGLARGSEKT